MKVLIIARLRDEANAARIAPHIRAQAAAVWSTYKSNQLREMYYWAKENKPGGAVLVYETDTVEAASDLARSLPIAQAELVDFEVYVLEPYLNVEVLFAASGEPING